MEIRSRVSNQKLIKGFSQIDYLTCTCTNATTSEALLKVGRDLILDEYERGNDQKPWYFKGYVGQKCGQVSAGWRADGAIVMVSGEAAHHGWQRLIPQSDRVTRIDFAVTIELARPDPDIAKVSYQWLKENRGVHGDITKFTFITHPEGGDTLYVGKRTSPNFGRLYDKSAESGDREYGLVWRYEVEVKKPSSSPLARAVLDEPYPQDYVQKYVWDWFNSRHVPPLFEYKGGYAPLEIEARVTDDDRTLNWLSTQVSPAIIRLTKKGKLAQVIDALGMDKLHAVSPPGV